MAIKPDTAITINNLIITETIAKKKSLHQISFLRMVASVSVCLFHLVCSNFNILNRAILPSTNLLAKICSYGRYGVQVFFIISGFIICYSLPSNYKLKDLNIFFKKRLLRVEPPYLLSILLTLSVAYLISLITANPVIFSWEDLFFHLGYMNNFSTTHRYFNGVYWTLGIEFQFYIIIGLLFSLMNRSVYLLALIIIIFLASSYVSIDNTSLIMEQFPLFCIGILMYFIMHKNEYPKGILLLLISISLIVIAFQKTEFLLTAIFTILIILTPLRQNKLITFLSNISYSLYLTHLPIGLRLVNFSLRFVKSLFQRYLVIALSLTISIGVAYLFYILIERWTTNLSKKIRYAGTGYKSLSD